MLITVFMQRFCAQQFERIFLSIVWTQWCIELKGWLVTKRRLKFHRLSYSSVWMDVRYP